VRPSRTAAANTGVAIIWTIGIVVVIAGAILALLGMAGH
jgi:hypothetical protein